MGPAEAGDASNTAVYVSMHTIDDKQGHHVPQELHTSYGKWTRNHGLRKIRRVTPRDLFLDFQQ